MAIRTIVLEGDDILRKKCREVQAFDEKLFTLLDDMRDTLYDSGGVGLAAPQVGILKRIAVIDVGEGCLSSPGEFGLVERPTKVKVKAQDRYGREFVIEGRDLLARAFCHEIDHLSGILFKDLVIRMLAPDER